MDKYAVLKNYFGHLSFRGGQEQIVDSLIAGRDALCIMPTGAGKSICYQIPAMILPGVMLVISPLISLMKDQVNALTQAGIQAAFINSSLTVSQYNRVIDQACSGAYKIIYVAPERLMAEDFIDLCMRISISIVAVDEAHCISQWGQDFRPSYLKIADFISGLPARPVIGAFTATATEEVKADIAAVLGLNDAYTITTGFDRPNLYFSVMHPKNKNAGLMSLLEKRGNQSGIIYCATRKAVEEVCALLIESGYAAAKYHAGLSERERKENQEDFAYDRKPVMVATNAFGMGIDKSNVSYVIHYNMPKNIESYYQEAGRAGRDGANADCILLYSARDVRINQYLIDISEPSQEISAEVRDAIKSKDYERLKHMTFYCTAADCLRGFILRYFGEKASDYCGNCSNCKTGFETMNMTVEAQKVLSCIVRTRQKFGVKMICDVVRGSRVDRLIRLGFDKQSTYGLLSELSEKRVRSIINALLQQGFLESGNGEYPVLLLTPKANELLRGEVQFEMKVAGEQTPKPYESGTKANTKNQEQPANEGLFDDLKRLRAALAADARVPAYVVFPDTALLDMCRKLPLTPEAFLEVSGVGQAKLDRYGDAFIRVIIDYCSAE